MKPVSVKLYAHYEHIKHIITYSQHTYNALYVVMVMIRVKINPNLAYNYDYTAL